MRTWIYEK